jgi:maltooligosyltrehalose trehalohydrolase
VIPSAGRSAARGWSPSLGAWVERGGVRFRVFAPERTRVELVWEGGGPPTPPLPLERDPAGYWSGFARGAGAGALYRYRLDGEGPFPDPASRYQPYGVHGPSQVVDPASFPWTDSLWRGVGLEELVVYELHVGTFTPAGTFAGAAGRLEDLKHLGVTAIELMPLADFPGRRNWGYDGVDLFAPARCYGTPDDLRRLVDRAHSLGLAVLLDVVYNHLGPAGAYLGVFSRSYFSESHHTPWGAAVNLDGPGSPDVRGFFVENALHWVHEYHLDGLRLDACHALLDDSPRYFLAELQDRVRGTVAARKVLVIAEDSRNLVRMVLPEAEGGWGLDAVWADDLHHQVRVALAGDRDGYYRDFSGALPDLAATVRDGWFFQGQRSAHFGGPRGTDPRPAPPRRFVVCIQNHDQVGNRALGERLHHQVDLAVWRAVSTLLLVAPETPLLFMGQEWGASSPFLFFTDHEEALGALVTEGRRKEFAGFRAFSDPAARERIPDPQAEETFARSRLDWTEAEREPHASLRRLYRALLARRAEWRLGRLERGDYDVAAGDGSIVLRVDRPGERRILAVVRLAGTGRSELGPPGPPREPSGWRVALSTEDPAFARDPTPPGVDLRGPQLLISWQRAGAVVLTD